MGWGLELLSDDEVEVAAAVGLRLEAWVETVAPVDTEHTDHRQEDTYTGTQRTLQGEGVEVTERGPGITGFGKSQTVDSARALQHEWVAEFGYEAVHNRIGLPKVNHFHAVRL